jgi:acyl-CoA reductase-like NAD-dependent aldehyde dehydrogenase
MRIGPAVAATSQRLWLRGERCMAGSVALGVGNIGDELVSRLVDKASKMKVGLTTPVLMDRPADFASIAIEPALSRHRERAPPRAGKTCRAD